MLDDPTLYITPVYENGEHGEQCTWQQWPEKHKSYIAKKRGDVVSIFMSDPLRGWIKVDYEHIAVLESSYITIKLLYENGEESKPLKLGEWLNSEEGKRFEHTQAQQKKSLLIKQKEESEENKKKQEKESQTEWASNLANIAATLVPTCSLVRYTCRFFIVVFCLNCLCAGIVAGCACFEPPVSILVGLIIGGLCICIVNAIVSVWTNEKEGNTKPGSF